MSIAYVWRYRFNPKKSAILVFGESERENNVNSKFRNYKLGSEPIKETHSYDHLGLKNNALGQNKERIKEKISKGRKVLNAASGLGLKPGGLTIKACGMIFWAMVVPVITFACELWVLDDEDIALLEDFQTYAGRRIQRFRQSSPRATSYVGLGWIRVELYIYIKKLIFIRTIAMLGEDSVCKGVFVQRFNEFNQNIDVSFLNVLSSPTFDMLRIAHAFGLEDVIGQMLHGTRVFSKVQWKNIVWTKAWEIEHQDWNYRRHIFDSTKYLSATSSTVRPLIWWQLSDISHDMMASCETMSKLVCRASKLKSDSYQYKNNAINRPYCDLCDAYAIENVEHLIMHCTSLTERRDTMLREISNLENFYGNRIVPPTDNNLHVMLGKVPLNADPEMMLYFYTIVATHVHRMYEIVVRNREGIG